MGGIISCRLEMGDELQGMHAAVGAAVALHIHLIAIQFARGLEQAALDRPGIILFSASRCSACRQTPEPA